MLCVFSIFTYKERGKEGRMVTQNPKIIYKLNVIPLKRITKRF